MTGCDRDPAGTDVLREQALAWLRRLTGGEATSADLVALNRWREVSPDHRRAFAEAALLWETLGDAAVAALACNPAVDFSDRPAFPGRRAFIFGGGALSASLAGLAAVRPPLGLWPSLSEWKADYRTRRGERRKVVLAAAAQVELNTQTSIGLHPATAEGASMELIAGEAVVAVAASASDVVVLAGSGRTGARQGTFNIRKEGDAVCVTCLDGEVEVRTRHASVSLQGGQQVSYGTAGLDGPVSTDPEVVAAWRQGLLVFREASLDRLVDEVNRYRPGKIVLLDPHLAQRRVVATFRLDRIDDAITFVQQVMNVPARFLPGGIVLLG